MNTRFNEVPFVRNAKRKSKKYHEVFLLMKIQQTKPQVINLNNNHYDFHYTVIKNRDEKENVDNEYENDFISLNVDIIPNHYVGIKEREK